MASKIGSKIGASQGGGTTMGTTRTQGASTQGGTILGIGLGTALDGSNVSAATSRPTYQSTMSGGTALSTTQRSNVSFMSILATSVRTGRQKVSRIRDAKGRKAVLIGCCCGLFISLMMGAATLLVIGIMLGVDIKYSNLIIESEERPIIPKNFPPFVFPSEKDTMALLPNLSSICHKQDPCGFFRRQYVLNCKQFICDSVLPDIEIQGDLISKVYRRTRRLNEKRFLPTPQMSPCQDGGLVGLCVDGKCMTTLSQDDPLKKGDPNFDNFVLRDYMRISAKERLGGWRLLPALPDCDFEDSLKKNLYVPCGKDADYTVELKVCDSPWPQFSTRFCNNELRVSSDHPLPFHEYQFIMKLCPGKKYVPDKRLDCTSDVTPMEVMNKCQGRDFKPCCFITAHDTRRVHAQGLCFMGLCLLPPKKQ